MLVINLNNNQARTLAWMREEVYEWWLVHTDFASDTAPQYGPLGRIGQFMKTSFGNCLNAQGPNGPNKESDNV